MNDHAPSRQTQRKPGAAPPRSLWLRATISLAGVLLATGCAASPGYRIDFAGDSAVPEIVAPGAVVMVLSAAPTQTLADGTIRETGYFLNEFYVPYRELVNEGYEVVIATPGGRLPALDPESLKEDYWAENPEDFARALEFIETDPQMKTPLSLNEVASNSSEYQAIVVPGGQGVMVDLLNDSVLHDLLLEFGRTDRPVGLICHAPAILTRLETDLNPFAGRRVTTVSGIEEWYIETFIMGADAQDRLIARQLRRIGYRVSNSFPGRPHAVRDCNLVTNQNPYSGQPFNELFLQALSDWRSGGRCVQNGGRT
jgi:putative intracellular protease/amidase